MINKYINNIIKGEFKIIQRGVRHKYRLIFIIIVSILIIPPTFSIHSTEGDLIDPGALKNHQPINIISNWQFKSVNGVISGNGTKGNPYIIQNWAINAKNADGIYIRNTDAHFIVKNCHIYNGLGQDPGNYGIYIYNVKNGSFEDNRMNLNYYGIYSISSYNNTILNCAFNKNKGSGIYLRNSDNNTITNCTFNSNNGTGISIRYSNNNVISNNIFTSNVYDGISLETAYYNLIQNNTLDSNNLNGISVKGIFNKIFNNICNSNIENGISIYGESNMVINNTCNLNNLHGIILYTIWEPCTQNTIINNSCDSNNYNGIFIKNSNKNIISNNSCISNNMDGISIGNSNNNNITHNICNSNVYNGISIESSNNNRISTNKCNSNNNDNICLRLSNDNIIVHNNCISNNGSGINIVYSNNNTCHDNTMTLCGILIKGYLLEHWNTHNISTTNIINNKPIHYWKNLKNGVVPLGAGEVILANCQNIRITEQNLSSGSSSIILAFTSNSIVSNNICTRNNRYGMYLYNSSNNIFINNTYTNNNDGVSFFYSSDNTIDNCSISSNLNYDFYLNDDSKNNIAINTTFNTIYFYDLESELIVKNYLKIQVYDSNSKPFKGVDVRVKDNNWTIYSTPRYGGIDPKTNAKGQIQWLLITDRIYKGCANATENITMINIKHENPQIISINKEINMSTSHFEYFFLKFNHLPSKIILKSPFNNSYINNTNLELKWNIGKDNDGDLLKYYVQLDEFGGDWKSLVDSKSTKVGELNWTITTPLLDGHYQWRVCAHDGYLNGSWSSMWRFTIDTKAPTSEITKPVNNGCYNNLDSISGFAFDFTNSSGIYKVEIIIQRLSDDYCWDGTNWQKVESYLPVMGTEQWLYNTSDLFLVTDNYYLIRSRATDNAGNLKISETKIKFLFDNKPPNISILINNDVEYTNSTSVILSLQAEDSGSEVFQMAFSTDNLEWSDWEKFNKTRLFNLSYGDGERRVYFKAQDRAHNFAEPIFDSIILDTTPPHSLSILINDGASKTISTLVTLKLNAIDNTSGVYQMFLTTKRTSWNVWEDYMEIKSYRLSPDDGIKTIYFRVIDKAGNKAGPVSDTILLNTTSPLIINETREKPLANLVFWAILIIIFIVIIIPIFIILVILRKKRGKQELLAPGITLEQRSKSSMPKQSQEITPVGVSSQPASSTTATTTPPPEQIPQVPQLLQLPPAQIQPETSAPEQATPTPTVVTPRPTLATTTQGTPKVPEVSTHTPTPTETPAAQTPTPTPTVTPTPTLVKEPTQQEPTVDLPESAEQQTNITPTVIKSGQEQTQLSQKQEEKDGQ